MRAMKIAAVVWVAVCMGAAVGAQGPASADVRLRAAATRMMDENDEVGARFSAAGWMLIHCATEEGMERVRALMEALGEFGGGHPDKLKDLGGADKFFASLRALLSDPDPVVRGFVALTLGAAKDTDSKPAIAALLKTDPKRANTPSDEYFATVDRGMAAEALGLMGATELAPDLAAMLKDADAHARGGAAYGLAVMGARDRAKEIAALLGDDEDGVRIAAMLALGKLGAKEFAPQIVAAMERGGDPSIHTYALMALVELRAKEQSAAIAKGLADEFQAGESCRALAFLGAAEYAKAIAALAESDKPLTRQAALVSLGVLGARDYEAQVAAHLDDKEEFVRPAAAVALVLMRSNVRAREAAALADGHIDSELGFSACRMPFDDLRALRARAATNLKAMEPALP